MENVSVQKFGYCVLTNLWKGTFLGIFFEKFSKNFELFLVQSLQELFAVEGVSVTAFHSYVKYEKFQDSIFQLMEQIDSNVGT